MSQRKPIRDLTESEKVDFINALLRVRLHKGTKRDIGLFFV